MCERWDELRWDVWRWKKNAYNTSNWHVSMVWSIRLIGTVQIWKSRWHSMHLLYLTIICPKLVVRLISYFVFLFVCVFLFLHHIDEYDVLLGVLAFKLIHSQAHIYREKIADQLGEYWYFQCVANFFRSLSFSVSWETSDRNNNHHHHIIHFISVMNIYSIVNAFWCFGIESSMCVLSALYVWKYPYIIL